MAEGFTHKLGEVLEARHITESRTTGTVGGNNTTGSISTTVTHFNRCRVKWRDGDVEFVDLQTDYSVGDTVGVVFYKGKLVFDWNMTTSRHYTYLPKLGCLAVLVVIAGFILIFFFGLGFLVLGGGAYWNWGIRIPALKKGLAEEMEKLRAENRATPAATA